MVEGVREMMNVWTLTATVILAMVLYALVTVVLFYLENNVKVSYYYFYIYYFFI